MSAGLDVALHISLTGDGKIAANVDGRAFIEKLNALFLVAVHVSAADVVVSAKQHRVQGVVVGPGVVRGALPGFLLYHRQRRRLPAEERINADAEKIREQRQGGDVRAGDARFP